MGPTLNQKISLMKFYIKKGEIEKSKEVAAEMIRSDPESPYGYVLMAFHFYLMKQTEDVLIWVEKMLQRAPEDEVVLMTAAELYEDLKYDEEKRRELIDTGLRIYPENAYFHVQYAILNRSNVEQALQSFQEALRLNPHDDVNLGSYAVFLYGTGNLKEAEKYEKLALEANPENSKNLLDFAWIAFQRQKYKRAQILIDEAMRLDPTNPVIREYDKKIYPTKNILVRAKIDLNQILLKCWGVPANKICDLFADKISYLLLYYIVLALELGGLFALLGKNLIFIIGGYILLLIFSKQITKSMLKKAGLTDAEEAAMTNEIKLTQEAALKEMKRELAQNQARPEGEENLLSGNELETQLSKIWSIDNIKELKEKSEAKATISAVEPLQEKPLFITSPETSSETSPETSVTKKKTILMEPPKEYHKWPVFIMVLLMVLSFTIRFVPAKIEKASQPKPIPTEEQVSINKFQEDKRSEDDQKTIKDNLPAVTQFIRSIREGNLADTMPSFVAEKYVPILRNKLHHPLLSQLANARIEKVTNVLVISNFLLVNDQKNMKVVVKVYDGKITHIYAKNWSDSVKEKEGYQKWLNDVELNGKKIAEMTEK